MSPWPSDGNRERRRLRDRFRLNMPVIVLASAVIAWTWLLFKLISWLLGRV